MTDTQTGAQTPATPAAGAAAAHDAANATVTMRVWRGTTTAACSPTT